MAVASDASERVCRWQYEGPQMTPAKERVVHVQLTLLDRSAATGSPAARGGKIVLLPHQGTFVPVRPGRGPVMPIEKNDPQSGGPIIPRPHSSRSEVTGAAPSIPVVHVQSRREGFSNSLLRESL